jgi:hypothetical protein
MLGIQWRDMSHEMRQKWIYREIRKFDEGGDAAFIRRRIATWQTEDMMRRAVSDRDHPTTFLG